MFEIGCDLFQQSGHGNSYKPMDSWWLIDADDIMYRIEDLSMEKVTANRIKYIFDEKMAEWGWTFILCIVHSSALWSINYYAADVTFTFSFRVRTQRYKVYIPGLKWLQSYWNVYTSLTYGVQSDSVTVQVHGKDYLIKLK